MFLDRNYIPVTDLNIFFENLFIFSGTLMASGQINHMGFRAYVIVWDWEAKKEKFRHELHKVILKEF